MIGQLAITNNLGVKNARQSFATLARVSVEVRDFINAISFHFRL